MDQVLLTIYLRTTHKSHSDVDRFSKRLHISRAAASWHCGDNWSILQAYLMSTWSRRSWCNTRITSSFVTYRKIQAIENRTLFRIQIDLNPALRSKQNLLPTMPELSDIAHDCHHQYPVHDLAKFVLKTPIRIMNFKSLNIIGSNR